MNSVVDSSWIENAVMSDINVKILCVNSGNEMAYVTHKKCKLEYDSNTMDGVVTMGRFIALIQSNKRQNYRISNILLYNVTAADGDAEMREMSLLKDIRVPASHPSFHPINTLYIMFSERINVTGTSSKSKSRTRKKTPTPRCS